LPERLFKSAGIRSVDEAVPRVPIFDCHVRRILESLLRSESGHSPWAADQSQPLKKGIPYTFDNNGALVVNPLSVFVNPGFRRQLNAAAELRRMVQGAKRKA
jgi:hypothetical protein